MKKWMLRIAVSSACLCLLAAFHENTLGLAQAISFGTIAYHFWMRLAVGALFDRFMNNRANLSARWYQPRPFEEKLYRKLKVHHWKRFLPSYEAALFDLKEKSLPEIAQAMCQAELVHETIIVLSFFPLLAAIPFGELPAFLITSLLAACFDGLFIILQRYNRPRIIRLMQRTRTRKQCNNSI